jgi:hypothetical protein
MIYTTNFGEALYPYLTIADTKFDPMGKYHVKLKVKSEDAQIDIAIINDVIAKKVADFTKENSGKGIKRADLPYEVTDDGFVIFHFKMKASGINSKTKQPFEQKPKIFDHNLELFPEDKSIWSGSIIRITYEPFGYSGAATGIGCTLRLKSVQVKKLVEGNINHGFTKVEPEITTVF